MSTVLSPLVRSAIIAAFAGFLFGFDTIVISGAEQTIQALWGLTSAEHGLAVSMALWGTVLGSVIGARPTDAWGRRPTLLVIGALYFLSAVWSGLATEVYGFMVARFVGGLGVGVSTVAAPLYISEISPPDRRGRLAGLFQLNIVLGILVAFLSNALLEPVGANAWRWMLGVEAIPALAYTLMCFAIPESPRWLIDRRGDRAGALEVLHAVDPAASRADRERLADEIQTLSLAPRAHSGFWRLRRPVALVFAIAMFNQLSGINAVLYFAPRIFSLTGLESQAALLQSVGIGVTNLVFTFVGLWLIDRAGRRQLLLVGSLGYIASLGTCALAFATETYAVVPYSIFAFIASHAVGQGAVIWVFISELFPTAHRAHGQSLGSATHWVFAALLTLVFPSLVELFAPAQVFGFFCGMMVLQLGWVLTLVPETKGVPLEQIQRALKLSPDVIEPPATA